MSTEVITSKFVKRDINGYIQELELYTNKRRVYCFGTREPALWANSHYQKHQAIVPGDITVNYTVDKR
jgi:hypothetical protein